SGAANMGVTLHWEISSVSIVTPGTGYVTPPAVSFSTGPATATASIGSPSAGNPSVPGFFQQRMVLAGQQQSPQSFQMSQTGAFFNFDISNPTQDNDAIGATIVSGQLNVIKSMISQAGGLIVLTDKVAYLVNGGSLGAPVT